MSITLLPAVYHPHHEGFPHGLCSANKEQHSYNCAFKGAALNLGLTIDSTSLMCNFKLHHSTFQLLGIGVATTTSCKQSGVKFNHLGLLKSTSPINDPALCVEAFAFCPPAFVRTAWLGVQQEPPHVDWLIDYFDSTWING